MYNFPRLNLYAVLGLPSFAEAAEVKKRFHELILIHHPDRGGDHKKAVVLNSAYDILSKQKVEYDEFLRSLLAPRPRITVVYGWTNAATSSSSGVYYTTF